MGFLPLSNVSIISPHLTTLSRGRNTEMRVSQGGGLCSLEKFSLFPKKISLCSPVPFWFFVPVPEYALSLKTPGRQKSYYNLNSRMIFSHKTFLTNFVDVVKSLYSHQPCSKCQRGCLLIFIFAFGVYPTSSKSRFSMYRILVVYT